MKDFYRHIPKTPTLIGLNYVIIMDIKVKPVLPLKYVNLGQ